MTKEEKERYEEYGTAYPCCGNCENLREAAWTLMCRKTLDYRQYGSLKCVYYKFRQNVQKLEELL